ncbi:MAG: hypothetical protein ACYSWU_24695 [Planctomycetota bacterium]|jgi:hypothetical protein
MAQPTPSDVHVDAALTDMSIAYVQSETNFIAGQVFPAKPVQFRTNKYHIFTKADWFRDDAVVKRAPNAGAPRAGFRLSTDSYECEPWWSAVPLDQAAMQIVTQRMMIKREALFATEYMATGKWGTDVTGATDFTRWDDASSDPEKDVQTGKRTVLVNTGLEPNSLTVAYDVHIALKRLPLIKDRFKYTSSESITDGMLAAFFEVDNYRIAKSVYATETEAATETFVGAFAIGKHALLTHDNGSPSLMQPTAAANFVWSGLTGVNDLGIRIDQFYDDDTKTDVVRGEFAFDMKITGSDLGYFFATAVA